MPFVINFLFFHWSTWNGSSKKHAQYKTIFLCRVNPWKAPRKMKTLKQLSSDVQDLLNLPISINLSFNRPLNIQVRNTYTWVINMCLAMNIFIWRSHFLFFPFFTWVFFNFFLRCFNCFFMLFSLLYYLFFIVPLTDKLKPLSNDFDFCKTLWYTITDCKQSTI